MTDALGPGLQLEEVSLRFGGQTVLDKISLQLSLRQVVGLIGPNGSGKTSLCNVIGGAYRPTDGRVCVLGQRTDNLPNWKIGRLPIARTFQTSALVDDLSAWENVALGLRSDNDRGLFRTFVAGGAARQEERERRQAVIQVLTEIGMPDDAILSPASALPNTQRKMVELARCLVRRPQVLLLDELASGLNTSDKRQVATGVRLALDKYCPDALVVIIEHDIDFIRTLCPTSIVLDQGRILAHGSTHSVLADESVQDAYLGRRDQRNTDARDPQTHPTVKDVLA